MFEKINVKDARAGVDRLAEHAAQGAKCVWGFAKRHRRELLVATGVGGLCAAAVVGAIGTTKAAVAVGAILATDIVIGVTTAVIVAKRRDAAPAVAASKAVRSGNA